MKQSYIFIIIKRNWRTIFIIIGCLIVAGFLIKNISESPYENKHLLNTTYPLKFKYNDKVVQGFIYISYWVKVKPSSVENISEDKLTNYISKKGNLPVKEIKKDFITALKSYSAEEVKQKWLDDREYFKKRSPYFIDNDPRLEKIIKKADPEIGLPYELKKVFFVYLKQES